MSSPLDLSDLEAEAFGKPKAPEPALDLGDLEAEAFGKTAAPEPAPDLSDLEAEAFGRQDLGRELGLIPEPGVAPVEAPKPITLAEIERTPGERLGLHKEEDPHVVDLVTKQGINIDVARTMATEGVATESEARRILGRKGVPGPVLSPEARARSIKESMEMQRQPAREQQLTSIAQTTTDPMMRAAMHLTANDRDRRVLEGVWGPMSGEGAAKFIMKRALNNLALLAQQRAETPAGMDVLHVERGILGDPATLRTEVVPGEQEWGHERGFLSKEDVERELYTGMLATAYARKKLNPLEYIFAQTVPGDHPLGVQMSKRILTYKRIAEASAEEQYRELANEPMFHNLRNRTDLMYGAKQRGMRPFKPVRQFAKWFGEKPGPVVGPALASRGVYFTNNEAEARAWLANQQVLEEIDELTGPDAGEMVNRRSLLMAISEAASIPYLVAGNMLVDAAEMAEGIAGSQKGYLDEDLWEGTKGVLRYGAEVVFPSFAEDWLLPDKTYRETAGDVEGVPLTGTRQRDVSGPEGVPVEILELPPGERPWLKTGPAGDPYRGHGAEQARWEAMIGQIRDPELRASVARKGGFGIRGGRFLTPQEFHMMTGGIWERKRELLASVKRDQYRRREFQALLRAEDDQKAGNISHMALEMKRTLYEDEFSVTTRGTGKLEGIVFDILPDPGRVIAGTWREARELVVGMVPMAASAAYTVLGPKTLADKWGATAQVTTEMAHHIEGRYKDWIKHGAAHMLEKGLIGASVDVLLPFQLARAAVSPIARHFLGRAQVALYKEAGISTAGKTLSQIKNEAVERGIPISKMDPHKLVAVVEDGDLWLSAKMAEAKGKAKAFRGVETQKKAALAEFETKAKDVAVRARAVTGEAEKTAREAAKVERRALRTEKKIEAGKPISKAESKLLKETKAVQREMAAIEERLAAPAEPPPPSPWVPYRKPKTETAFGDNPKNLRPEYRLHYRKAMDTHRRNLAEAESLEAQAKHATRKEIQDLTKRAEGLTESVASRQEAQRWLAAETKKITLREELRAALAKEREVLMDLQFRGREGAIKPKGGPQRQGVQSVQRGLERRRAEVNRIASEIDKLEEVLNGKAFEKIYESLEATHRAGRLSFDVKGRAFGERMAGQKQAYAAEAGQAKAMIEAGSRTHDLERLSKIKSRQRAIDQEIKDLHVKSALDDTAEIYKLRNHERDMKLRGLRYETQAGRWKDLVAHTKDRLREISAEARSFEEAHRALAKNRMYQMETHRATHVLGPSLGEYIVRPVMGKFRPAKVPRKQRLARGEPAAPRLELHIEGKPGTIKRVGLFKSQAYKRTRSPLEKALDRHDLWDAAGQAIDLGGQFLNPLYGGFSLANAVKNRLIKGHGYLGFWKLKVPKHQLRWLLKDVDNVVPELVFAELRKAQGAGTAIEFELGEHLADLYREAKRTGNMELVEEMRNVLQFESEAVVQSMEIVGYKRTVMDTEAMAALSKEDLAARAAGGLDPYKGVITKTLTEPTRGPNGYIQYKVRLPSGIVAEFDGAGLVIADTVKLDQHVLQSFGDILTREGAVAEGVAGKQTYARRLSEFNEYNSRLEKFKAQLPALNNKVGAANKWAAPIATKIRDAVTQLGLSEELFYAPGAIRGRLWMPNSYIDDGLDGLTESITNRVRGTSLKNNQLRRNGVPIEIRELPRGDRPWDRAGPEMERWKALLEKIPDPNIRARVRQNGGYGMNTDLAKDLLIAIPEAVRDFAYFKAYRIISRNPNIFTTVEGLAKARGWVKMSDVIKGQGTWSKNLTMSRQKPVRPTKPGKGDWRWDEAATELEAGKLMNSPYGRLSEGWVAPEVAEFLTQAERASRASFDLLDKSTYFPAAVGMWKGFKTIYSISTHTTNFLSNALFLAPIAGMSPINPLNWGFIAKTARQFLGGSKSALYKDFVNYGGKGLRGGPQRSEIVRAAEQAQASMYSGLMGRSKYFLEDIGLANRNIVAGRRTGYRHMDSFIKRHGADNFGLLYQAGDDFWRFAIFLKRRDAFLKKNVYGKQLSASERAALVEEANIIAVKKARKDLADYENLAGWAQINRNSVFGMPFLSFEVRTMERVQKWIVERPWEAELWLAHYDSMSHYNFAEAGISLKAVDEFYSNLPWYEAPVMQIWAAVDPDHGYVVEWDGEVRDKKGRLMPSVSRWQTKIRATNVVKYVPNIRFLPLPHEAEAHGWSSFVDAGNRALLGGSPILATFVNLFAQRDFFYDKKDLSGAEITDLIARRWMPNIPIIPKSYGHDRIQKAKARKPRGLRDMPESVSQAQMASWWGIRDVAYSIGQLRKVGPANIWRKTKHIMDELKRIEDDAAVAFTSIGSLISPVRMQFEAADFDEEAVRREALRSGATFNKMLRRYKGLLRKLEKAGKRIEGPVGYEGLPAKESERAALQDTMSEAKVLLLALYERAGLDVQRDALPLLDKLMGVYQSEMERLSLDSLEAFVQDEMGQLKQPKMKGVVE